MNIAFYAVGIVAIVFSMFDDNRCSREWQRIDRFIAHAKRCR